ncbi:pyruvate formate lyase family protein [Candidatus Poribacteria bacterium]
MIHTEQIAETLPTPRVTRLLERWHPTGNERTWSPNGGAERSVLLWQYFTGSEDESIALRRARGLNHILREIAIDIYDDELIVGEVGLEDVTQTRPDELSAARSYWGERKAEFAHAVSKHESGQEAGSYGLSTKWQNRDGHAIPAFDMILSSGLDALRAEAQKAASSYPSDAPDYVSRQEQWQAMMIALEALSAYIRRYAELARQMASSEAQPQRRNELIEIAEVCEWVAEKPARTFREALQLVWFVHLGIKMDDGGVGHSFGRFDQYLCPFYESDLDAGRLTVDQARELLALFWLKLNREGDDIAHLSLGGQTSLGDDAVNDLSLLCLQVDRWISRKQPNLSTRVHSGTSDAYWHEIARTIRRGAGHPAVFNDDVIIPGLLDYELPEKIVRDYAQVGCVETFLPGLGAPWTDCYLNLAKCLELALNDGRDMASGHRLGPETGDPHGFGSFDALFMAYERQVEHALYQMLRAKDVYDAVISQYEPEPLNSAFIRDCLQRGLDATGGGARYLLTGAYGVGLGTTVDSLAAIKALIYDTERVKMNELLAALNADFQGYERVRSLCRNAPKYGNDDDRVDALAVQAIESFGHQMRNYPSPSPHSIHYGMLGSVLSHTKMGEKTAASANGRLAGETLSDGGSPSQGCNQNGATATLRSLSKPDYRLVPGGAAINLRLSPQYLQGADGLEKLVNLLKTYVAMGGEQLQVNVVDAETLRLALENPEQHRDLVVRVAGFTAYFVTLTPAIQQEIVARTAAEI